MSQTDETSSCKNKINNDIKKEKNKVKNEEFCRICCELSKEGNPLLQPCRCKGKIGDTF